jgi:RNA polymerase sigma-70 factor (ECF subfamily)
LRWDAAEIGEGSGLVERALARGLPGRYAIQAAIAAQHARAAAPQDTDWAAIAGMYAQLAEVAPSPVVELNRAVAVAMAEGPERGLALVDGLEGLDGYHLFHAARADLLRRLGRREEAGESYRRAVDLASNEVEGEFLRARMHEVS